MSSVPSNLIPTRITQLPEAPVADPAGYFPIVISGTTYKVQFSQISSNVQVPASRVINAGTGLTGGGSLSADITIAVANGGIGDAQLDTTGVSAGTYGDGTNVPVVTVNTVGRVTSLSTTPLVISGYVPDSRQIVAGSGLSGGGNLDQDRTLAIDFSSATPEPLGAATAGTGVNAAREDHVHPAVDLSDGNETTGELPMSRGGTGANLSPIAGAVVYSNGTNFDLSTAGSNGQVLTSTGGGAPTWTTITGIGTVTSVDGSGGTTGLTVSGGPITAAGTLTLGGTLAISAGGTGLAGTPTNGQLLIGNGSGYALSALTAGTGVSVTNATGSISIASTAPDQTVTLTDGTAISVTGTYPSFTVTNTAPDQTVVLTDGTAISVTGTYPSFTVTNSLPDQTVVLTDGTAISVTGTYPSFTVTNSAPDQTVVITGGGLISVSGTYPSFNVSATEGFSGTVTSIDVSGGTTGLTFSGGPVTDSGTITMAGTLSISAGGTGASTDSGARTALGLGTMAVQNANSVAITGGDISVGSANITTLTSSSVTVSSGATINGGAVFNETGADVDFRIESDTNANAFFLDGANGNVGIGTSPAAKLEVSASTAGDGIRVSGNNFAGTNYFGASVNPTGVFTGLDSGGGFVINVRDSGYQAFSTNNQERMRIDSSGNVGIGTSSPATAFGKSLHLYNDANTGTVASNTFLAIESVNRNANIDLSGASTATNAVSFSDTLGTTVAAVASSIADSNLLFRTGGTTERMRIDSSGNVGIGTSSPSTKLDVSGTISDTAGNVRAIPKSGSAKTTAYTLTISDVGQFIEVGSGGSITVPDATFAAGDVVSIFNNTTGNVTLTMSITTAYIGGTDSDKATITLATRGVATVLFISGTVCVVNGNVS